MENKEGMLKSAAAPANEGDSSLPDPTSVARIFLLVCIVAALVLAFLADKADWATRSFEPAKVEEANFALFAGFYVAAQLIERLMELASPLLPFWGLPASMGKADPKVRAAQVKADRAKAVQGLATLAGVAISAGFGLYFLKAVGIDIPRMPDIFFTGLIIAAGTKPLHDFITGLQNKTTPKTNSTA